MLSVICYLDRANLSFASGGTQIDSNNYWGWHMQCLAAHMLRLLLLQSL